jgi:hypothetical protein
VTETIMPKFGRLRVLLDIVARVLWGGAAVLCAWSAIAYAYAFMTYSMSAPQQAAQAADSLMWIISSYTFARAFDEITRRR